MFSTTKFSGRSLNFLTQFCIGEIFVIASKALIIAYHVFPGMFTSL